MKAAHKLAYVAGLVCASTTVCLVPAQPRDPEKRIPVNQRSWTFSSTPFMLLGFALLLAGCATPAGSVNNNALPFDHAIVSATDALVQQTQKMTGFLAKVEAKVEAKVNKRLVVLDPTLDAGSGQQTAATQYLDRGIAEHMARNFQQIEVLPFRASNLSKAQYLLTGTLVRAQGDYRLNLALVDMKGSTVVAQSSALMRQEGVDMSPLPYYRDSPVLVKDAVIDGYVRTSSVPPGQKADATYLDRIATATVVNDATILYNASRYQEALGQYRSALATPAGEQIRVLNGIYLSTFKLGQMAEAEEAFGRVVAYGIAYRQLGVKFLFSPGTTEFWSDPKISGAYDMWLRQIAKEGRVAKVCMGIVGHTSKTGTDAFNNALSLKRAVYIKQRLNTESPEVADRMRPLGMGFRQNIVGSGTDDLVDAPDRRVEFKITECPA
ncbi:OmpA family protein [Variovorax guangxiensis]|uniref:OmpA family protein n=1 Tax=Variovorax guangxiensis TaxID=1775474 RepID=UPI0028543149|nr:OmpA family protein [Variovorax guangxiensis]MDR6859827.1 tetratricopeptide (TPR) repeat protein [Variovorax guangxiensis]